MVRIDLIIFSAAGTAQVEHYFISRGYFPGLDLGPFAIYPDTADLYIPARGFTAQPGYKTGERLVKPQRGAVSGNGNLKFFRQGVGVKMMRHQYSRLSGC
jgi:hypothetical protein